MHFKVCTVVSVSNNEFCVAACNELCVSVHVSVEVQTGYGRWIGVIYLRVVKLTIKILEGAKQKEKKKKERKEHIMG